MRKKNVSLSIIMLSIQQCSTDAWPKITKFLHERKKWRKKKMKLFELIFHQRQRFFFFFRTRKRKADWLSNFFHYSGKLIKAQRSLSSLLVTLSLVLVTRLLIPRCPFIISLHLNFLSPKFVSISWGRK